MSCVCGRYSAWPESFSHIPEDSFGQPPRKLHQCVFEVLWNLFVFRKTVKSEPPLYDGSLKKSADLQHSIRSGQDSDFRPVRICVLVWSSLNASIADGRLRIKLAGCSDRSVQQVTSIRSLRQRLRRIMPASGFSADVQIPARYRSGWPTCLSPSGTRM